MNILWFWKVATTFLIYFWMCIQQYEHLQITIKCTTSSSTHVLAIPIYPLAPFFPNHQLSLSMKKLTKIG